MAVLLDRIRWWVRFFLPVPEEPLWEACIDKAVGGHNLPMTATRSQRYLPTYP